MKNFIKKRKKLCLIILVLVIVVAVVICSSVFNSSEETVNTDLDAEVQEDMTEEQEEIYDWILDTVYDVDAQSEIYEDLVSQQGEDDYTFDNMLVEYNPFGTNTLSLYVYFTTEESADVSYTVHVDEDEQESLELDTTINDFTHEGTTDETVHEFQVIGLIPDVENEVTFTITYADGSTDTNTITYDMGSLLGEEEIALEKTVESDEELEDGLFVVLGNDDYHIDFMYYYDNDGIIRGEVPIIGYRSHRLLFDDDMMYYSASETKMAQMNSIGQIVNVFQLDNYKLHHDYVFDDEGNILILGTDTRENTQEDVILMLDIESGETVELIDLGDLFPDYKEEILSINEDAEDIDWIHINTIQWLGDDTILLSAREVSTIINVTNIYDDPEVSYMLGSEDYWEDTGYEDLLYSQSGDFTIQGGQHTITYVEDDSLEEGQYYLYMFNNNIGISTTNPDFDWASIGLDISSAAEGEASYYYEYLVDENEGTFTLVDSFAVPYSGYVSSVQNIGSHTVVDSGIPATFGEYDEDHNLIASFTMSTEKFIYRVYKYEL